MREDEWKLLLNADGSDSQLYNLKSDPKETTNLADKDAELTVRLKAKALAWRNSLPKLLQSPANASP
jgi:arylsulfatase A-like enzyme